MSLGRWGKGFVVAVSRRWKAPELAYRAWPDRFVLGSLQLVEVTEGLWVANMVAQHRVTVKGRSAEPPIRYDALEECLRKLASEARRLQAEVHMPRIGCGLAGGRWELIEPIIAQTLGAEEIAVTVYDFPATT